MSSINIKVRVGASYHRFEVLAESGFEALRARLAELAASTFGPGDGFAVTYLDDESDEIAMQSDEDLQTALQLAAAPTRAHMPPSTLPAAPLRLVITPAAPDAAGGPGRRQHGRHHGMHHMGRRHGAGHGGPPAWHGWAVSKFGASPAMRLAAALKIHHREAINKIVHAMNDPEAEAAIAAAVKDQPVPEHGNGTHQGHCAGKGWRHGHCKGPFVHPGHGGGKGRGWHRGGRCGGGHPCPLRGLVKAALCGDGGAQAQLGEQAVPWLEQKAAELAEAAAARPALVGFCDVTKAKLVPGEDWYHKTGQSYDLCAAEHAKLGEAEQRAFVRVGAAAALGDDAHAFGYLPHGGAKKAAWLQMMSQHAKVAADGIKARLAEQRAEQSEDAVAAPVAPVASEAEPEQGSVPKTSPAGHPLVGFRAPHAGFRCDACDAALPAGAAAFGSRGDDYDLCERCFRAPAEPEDEETGAAPVASPMSEAALAPTAEPESFDDAQLVDMPADDAAPAAAPAAAPEPAAPAPAPAPAASSGFEAQLRKMVGLMGFEPAAAARALEAAGGNVQQAVARLIEQ